jgi:hypothetical protein
MPSALQLGGPHVSLTFAILEKGKVFFRTFGLRPSFKSQSEFIIYKNKLILRGATVGGLRFPSIIYYHRNFGLKMKVCTA